MSRLPHRRLAIGLLLCGLVLATGTPAYVAHAENLGVYLWHPAIFVMQAVPYVLCAGLWLPWRAPAAARTALVMAALLCLAALLAYVPMLLRTERLGSDMVALTFAAISYSTAAAVLVGSAVAAGILWIRSRH
jgi:hypothetical protein